MAKPTTHLDWVPSDDSSKVIEPTTTLKDSGYLPDDAPMAQHFNFFLNIQDKWIKYLETKTDQLQAQLDSFTITDAVSENMVGTVDGTNDTFHLTKTPTATASMVVWCGATVIPSTGYTLSGSTVTFHSGFIPSVGQQPSAFYIHIAGYVPVGGGGPGTGMIPKIEYRTLTATEQTNKALNLTLMPSDSNNTWFTVLPLGDQFLGVDWTITGNTISWAGLGLDDGTMTSGTQVIIEYYV